MRDFLAYLELFMSHVFDENYRETGTKVLRIPFALEQTFLLQSTPFVSTLFPAWRCQWSIGGASTEAGE